MFWNSEFLDSPSSNIDVILQSQAVKLSDILFEDDLLQELKTSNLTLANFLNRPEIIAELVNNITQLTEKDCCDKLLYSRVHAAYISCEILTGGSSEIFVALMEHPESLNKIISCLTVRPAQFVEPITALADKNKPSNDVVGGEVETSEVQEKDKEEEEEVREEEVKEEEVKEEKAEETKKEETKEEEKKETLTDDTPSLTIPPRPKTPKPSSTSADDDNVDGVGDGDSSGKPDEAKPQSENDSSEQQPQKIDNSTTNETPPIKEGDEDCMYEKNEVNQSPQPKMTKVVPQKATLVSKLISTIHSLAPANLIRHFTQDFKSFENLINILTDNIDISGSFEILSTFIKRTDPPEYRYVFCELLSKLEPNFAYGLIDVMTMSDAEDKQRNACQLLCDIIVIGRQDATEQSNSDPRAQDFLAELLESNQAVHVILYQMFKENMRNSTAVVCGMKVLQTLLEKKPSGDEELLAKTIEQTQEEIEKHLIKFHELLLNPPKQEPIKTTFGIIQKPLGYMRLEVVNLIRALISTNSPNIIRKLVELRTMKVIIDLFIEYSWNNLLHTQVEQALCLIINNCRHDEELSYQIDMQQHSHLNNHNNIVQSQTEDSGEGAESQDNQKLDQQEPLVQQATEIPSRALLSQLLNECDLIGRLLLTGSVTNSSQKRKNGEQANFGHIIQMINSIAINRDLDTIRDHLNEMKDKRPELYDRWTTFVNVDVASFKEISLYYDVHSNSNNVNHRYGQTQPNQISISQHLMTSNNSSPLNSSSSDNSNNQSNNGDDQFLAYYTFTKEIVIPQINVDVLPKLRRSKFDH